MDADWAIQQHGINNNLAASWMRGSLPTPKIKHWTNMEGE